MCKHTFTHVHLCVYQYIYMYIYMHVCTYIHLYIHIYYSQHVDLSNINAFDMTFYPYMIFFQERGNFTEIVVSNNILPSNIPSYVYTHTQKTANLTDDDKLCQKIDR